MGRAGCIRQGWRRCPRRIMLNVPKKYFKQSHAFWFPEEPLILKEGMGWVSKLGVFTFSRHRLLGLV